MRPLVTRLGGLIAHSLRDAAPRAARLVRAVDCGASGKERSCDVPAYAIKHVARQFAHAVDGNIHPKHGGICKVF